MEIKRAIEILESGIKITDVSHTSEELDTAIKLACKCLELYDGGYSPMEVGTIRLENERLKARDKTAKYHVYMQKCKELTEEIKELNADLAQSVSFNSFKNERNRAYLIGYEDGRLNNKCDYEKLDEVLRT